MQPKFLNRPKIEVLTVESMVRPLAFLPGLGGMGGGERAGIGGGATALGWFA